jgi:hypothetical protein
MSDSEIHSSAGKILALSLQSCPASVTWTLCDGDNTATLLDQHPFHTVTRAMKRQVVEDLFVFLVIRARQLTGMSDVSACFSSCTSQEPTPFLVHQPDASFTAWAVPCAA